MTSTRVWNFGDRVVHTGKPEWGTGVISAAQKSSHEGSPCQLLTIRFERAGLKTITTAFANLIPAEQAASLPNFAEPAQSDAPALSGAKYRVGGGAEDDFAARLAGGPEIREQMTKLPEPATDPFSSPIGRLKATLGLYKFAPTGASLLDWAAIQSGLADPMSRFNRHELEKFFEAFVVARDQHLKKVVLEARKADPAATSQALAQCPPGVQHVMRRLDIGR